LIFGASADKDIDGNAARVSDARPAEKNVAGDKVIVTKSYIPVRPTLPAWRITCAR